MSTPTNPAAFWNERYSAEAYAYGVLPNLFFKSFLDDFQGKPGRMLLPAEGEGRNAVYAAKKGWQVTAVDFSETGREKAFNLAAQHGVTMEYLVMPVEQFDFEAMGPWDAVGLIFAHFPPHLREGIHHKCAASLAPGGMLILEAFNKKQLAFRHQSGGPADEAMLFDAAMLSADFFGLTVLECLEVHSVLEEGSFHRGEAELIRLLARRD